MPGWESGPISRRDRIRQLTMALQEEVAPALAGEADPKDEEERRLPQLRAQRAALRRRQQNVIATAKRAPDLEDALLNLLARSRRSGDGCNGKWTASRPGPAPYAHR